MILGIDEAGRGPVIGPMVIVGVSLEKSEEERLVQAGAKDSKMLTGAQREKIAKQIKKIAKKVVIRKVYPAQIDAAVLSTSTNLNWLEADVLAGIINEVKPKKVFVDCPSNNIAAFVAYLRKTVPAHIEIVADHKADAKFPVVSAASIIAKVTRDAEIEKIKREIGIDFGSGYPSDPLTQAFLAKHWNKYDFFRKSWSSYVKVAESGKQKTLSGFS